MEHVASRVKECVILGAVPLVVLAIIPIVGATVFILRPLAFVGLLAAFVAGAIIWICSMRFREWVSARAGVEIVYRGLRIAPDFAFDPSHSWARMNGEVVVGADDLVQATLGPIERVELPAKGRYVHRGDRLFRLRSADRSIAVRAPVSGTVIDTNKTLHDSPELVNENPFGEGWAVRLRGDHLEEDKALLLRGKNARNWFHDDVDRIVDSLPTSGGDVQEPSEKEAAHCDLHDRVTDERWNRLTKTIFAPHRVEGTDS